nr:hypothetical protein [Kibdelosporangium sp. MJ126-NF4]
MRPRHRRRFTQDQTVCRMRSEHRQRNTFRTAERTASC